MWDRAGTSASSRTTSRAWARLAESPSTSAVARPASSSSSASTASRATELLAQCAVLLEDAAILGVGEGSDLGCDDADHPGVNGFGIVALQLDVDAVVDLAGRLDLPLRHQLGLAVGHDGDHLPASVGIAVAERATDGRLGRADLLHAHRVDPASDRNTAA